MDEGCLIVFTSGGREYRVGRPPVKKRSALAAGEPSIVWRIRDDHGYEIWRAFCSDQGLPAVLDETIGRVRRRPQPVRKVEPIMEGRRRFIAVLKAASVAVTKELLDAGC